MWILAISSIAKCFSFFSTVWSLLHNGHFLTESDLDFPNSVGRDVDSANSRKARASALIALESMRIGLRCCDQESFAFRCFLARIELLQIGAL